MAECANECQAPLNHVQVNTTTRHSRNSSISVEVIDTPEPLVPKAFGSKVPMTLCVEPAPPSQDPNHWTEKERWLWVLSLFFGQTLLYSARTLLPVCSVAITKEFGWTKSQAGAVLGAFFWGYILTQYASGWLADRIGGEQVMTIGAIGWAIVTLFYPLLGFLEPWAMDTLFWMLLLRLLHGIFQGCHMPSVGSLMSIRVHLKQRGSTFSFLNTGAYFGTLLTGSVGSLLLENYGWRAPFYVVGASCFLWIFITRWILLPSRHTCSKEMVTTCLLHPNAAISLLRQRHMAHMKPIYQRTPPLTTLSHTSSPLTTHSYSATTSPPNHNATAIKLNPDFQIICIDSEEDNAWSKESTYGTSHPKSAQCVEDPPSPSKSTNGGPSSPPMPWKKLFSRKEFWAMMVGHYAYGHAHNILFSWLPTYFHDSFPEAKGWVFNVVPWLVTIPSSLVGGIMADHLIANGYLVSRVRKLMETFCLLGSCFFLCAISWTKDSYLQSLTFMALAVSCHGFHSSGIMLNPMDLAPEHGGAVFGLVNMCSALPGFLAVYFAGFVLQYTKSWIVVFNQTAFVCFFGWLIYMIFGSAERII